MNLFKTNLDAKEKAEALKLIKEINTVISGSISLSHRKLLVKIQDDLLDVTLGG